MSDFVSGFWEFYVGALTLISIFACLLLLWSQNKKRDGEALRTTGHVWDEDLQEWNNPLPNWWRWLFYLTIVFSLGYLAFYPGLAVWQGKLGWSAAQEYEQEQRAAQEHYGALYAKYTAMSVEDVAADPAARAMGQNLYLNYCAGCHASDARGGKGFPNLADKDWLYGGDPASIKTTIAKGRNGMMPPFGTALGKDGVVEVANYVLSLSGRTHDEVKAVHGRDKFQQNCAACHGAQGTGNAALGAPNLTDTVWLYGGSLATVSETISRGRSNAMPAWDGFLDESKIHMLAAYLWSLSNEPQKTAAKTQTAAQ